MRRLRALIVVALLTTVAFAALVDACNASYSTADSDAAAPADSPFDSSTTQAEAAAPTPDATAIDGATVTIFSFLSPSDPTGKLVQALPINWQIATDPPAMIYYTTNGADPTDGSASAMSPAEITTPEAGSVITWRSGGDPTVHSFVVQIDTALQTMAGSVTYDFRFAKSGSAIVHASPGDALSATVGTAIEWNEPQAATAIDQITYGMGDASIDCIVDQEPGKYPGMTTANTSIIITAPSAPGTYVVQLGFQRDYHCKPDSIGSPLTGPQIGIVIVD